MTEATQEVLDATVVDELVEEKMDYTPIGSGIERRPPPTREVLMPLDVDQVVDGMKAYQQMLPRLLDSSDYQEAGRGKRFVKKSGWRKIARAFNLSCEIVSVRVERDEHGEPTRAEAIVRAVAPNGLVSDGDGYCSIDEERFSGPRGNKSKVENDLRATATTRAKNRAISDMVGMGEVSAEEVAGGSDIPEAHPWGEPANTDVQQKAIRALSYLLDVDSTTAYEVFGKVVAETSPDASRQFFPKASARALLLAAGELKRRRESAPADEPAPTFDPVAQALASDPPTQAEQIASEVYGEGTAP